MFNLKILKTLALTCVIFLSSQNSAFAEATKGEPVPGAEVFVELEPDDQPITNTTTSPSGEIIITGLKKGKYKILVGLPKLTAEKISSKSKELKKPLYVNFTFDAAKSASPITFGSKLHGSRRIIRSKNTLFSSPSIEITDPTTTLKLTVTYSPNNYGINDEGIK